MTLSDISIKRIPPSLLMCEGPSVLHTNSWFLSASRDEELVVDRQPRVMMNAVIIGEELLIFRLYMLTSDFAQEGNFVSFEIG